MIDAVARDRAAGQPIRSCWAVLRKRVARWPQRSPTACAAAARSKATSLSSADKRFAGAEFEQIVRALAAELLRPDRRDEQPRFGSLGGVRQWIESIIDTIKGQLSLERHGGRPLDGVWARICQRVLALAIGVWHNWQLGEPGRGFTASDH